MHVIKNISTDDFQRSIFVSQACIEKLSVSSLL